jgi:uncharacterized protein (DUF1015 family)
LWLKHGFGHHFWVIRDKSTIKTIVDLFAKIKYTYVADGHHRTAAAALVGHERKLANPNHTGNEEYNYFLAVHFPANQLAIMDYNRVIKDLNGLSEQELLKHWKKDLPSKIKEPLNTNQQSYTTSACILAENGIRSRPNLVLTTIVIYWMPRRYSTFRTCIISCI